MKKLLAIAIAALPASALADVTLYGQVGAEVGHHKISGEKAFAVDPASKKLKGGVKINQADSSRIGFKGSEDLGNGLKAIWQIEQGLDFDEGGNAAADNRFATRDSFVGLSGDWGKVRLGRLSTYQNSDMAMVDSWLYAGGVNGLGIFTRNDGRLDNAVRYDSPDFAGFNFSVVYGVDEQRAYVGNNRTNKQTLNLGLGYANDGIFAAYSYLAQYDTKTDGSGKDQAHRVEFGYDANDLFIAAGFQHTRGYGKMVAYDGSVIGGADRVTSKEATLTVATTVGAFTPRLSYAQGWDLKAGSNDVDETGYKQFVIGADYELSKRTTAYASFGQVKWDGKIAGDENKERSFGVGVVHKF